MRGGEAVPVGGVPVQCADVCWGGGAHARVLVYLSIC